MNRSIRALPIWFASFALGACVTINIYFPAAAAERAADRIIEEVWGAQPQGAAPAPEPAKPVEPPHSGLELPLVVLHWLVPAAHAAHDEPDININTPAIRALRSAMHARHADLEPHYDSGAIGIDRRGLLTLRAPGQVPLRERNRVKQLVSQENRDRDLLYREIARANGQPGWEQKIRDTFTQRWIHNARAGWWCQGSDGEWYQK